MLFILSLITFDAWAFTLNSDTGRGFDDNKISIKIASTSCAGAGFSTSSFSSMVSDAVNDYWNQVPTSALILKNSGLSSIDIDGDQFSDALNKTPNNTILAGCNDDVTDFSSPSILGAAVMDCNGDYCKAVLILNATSGSYLANMSRNEVIAVIAHELGHAIGLGHSEFQHNLMYYSASGKKQKWLGEDDIDGVSYLYPHDSDLAGLFGSCGTIETKSDNHHHQFFISFLLSFFFFMLLPFFGRAYQKLSEKIFS